MHVHIVHAYTRVPSRTRQLRTHYSYTRRDQSRGTHQCYTGYHSWDATMHWPRTARTQPKRLAGAHKGRARGLAKSSSFVMIVWVVVVVGLEATLNVARVLVTQVALRVAAAVVEGLAPVPAAALGLALVRPKHRRCIAIRITPLTDASVQPHTTCK